ncbi:hypothetical protein M0805_003927 [Coniferiporia weirii]|nr:hypothetical protein M0805_003927 [Coniferiporia weirii]
MTPFEYAVRVQKKFAPLLEKTAEENLFLKDKVIFYVGGDYKYASKSTRNRMDFLRKKGAVVVPTYDPDKVTHIVTDARKGTTLEALHLKSLDEIPIHIPTVTWEWITSGNKGSLDIEFLHAAFPSRIEASPGRNLGYQNAKVKGKVPAAPLLKTFADDEFSRIEDFTVAEHTTPYGDVPMPMPKGNPHATTSKVQLPSNVSVSPVDGVVDDPLAEFYAQAKRDRDAKPMRKYKKYEQESDGDSPSPLTIAAQKHAFTCDQKAVNVGPCPNQDIVDKLSELSELHKTKLGAEEHWRVFSYGKSIRAIRNYPTRIRSYEEAKTIKDVGEKTALKIKEIIETGELKRIEHENTEDVRVINMFSDIYDVGPSTAYRWYASGCRTLEDIRQRKGGITLSPAQEIGLRFYDDINTRIPREEVADIFSITKTIALEIDPRLFIEIMGSYRRGRETCGDVDILMTRPTDDGRTHRGVLRRLLKELHLRGILTEDLAVPNDLDNLEGSYRGLCRLNEASRRRRIDILVVRYESRGAALIYYTFNRAIRYKAGKMGYSLNQRGLYSNVVRDPSDRRRKSARGIIVASETEEEIFRILGVPWQEPHERVRA